MKACIECNILYEYDLCLWMPASHCRHNRFTSRVHRVDIVEARCYFVDIGRTDRDRAIFSMFCTQLTKAFVAETSCNHCH